MFLRKPSCLNLGTIFILISFITFTVNLQNHYDKILLTRDSLEAAEELARSVNNNSSSKRTEADDLISNRNKPPVEKLQFDGWKLPKLEIKNICLGLCKLENEILKET